MRAIKTFIITLIPFLLLVLLVESYAGRKEIREVGANDRVMTRINLTMGRSTILSFPEKPIKVVSGNSNYFNVEFIGNDLTIQPLAQVETNLFVYTQSNTKYGFHLNVGSSSLYDDMVYVRWKSPYVTNNDENAARKESPQKIIPPMDLKLGEVEIKINKFTRLQGTKTYVIDFDVKNKGHSELSLKSMDVFVSRNNERLPGQKLFFEKEKILIHSTSKGRIFLPVEKAEDVSVYFSHGKLLRRKIISKAYL